MILKVDLSPAQLSSYNTNRKKAYDGFVTHKEN